MSTLYYYKSSNTLTSQDTHNLPLSSTLELWEVLTWPSESIWPAPHQCSLQGLLLFVLRRCYFECASIVWLIGDVSHLVLSANSLHYPYQISFCRQLTMEADGFAYFLFLPISAAPYSISSSLLTDELWSWVLFVNCLLEAIYGRFL